ncbi:MAG: MarR family transcriptional regulator, partial [Ignavibacteria bacterium]
RKIRAFNRYYTNVIGVVDRHILHSKYSLTEARILYEIYNNSGFTVRKIKNILQVDEGYLSRTIDKLIKQGLILKKQSNKDRRVFNLTLSKSGEREFLKLNLKSEESVAEMIDHLTPDEVVQLALIMDKISKLLTKKSKDRGN